MVLGLGYVLESPAELLKFSLGINPIPIKWNLGERSPLSVLVKAIDDSNRQPKLRTTGTG